MDDGSDDRASATTGIPALGRWRPKMRTGSMKDLALSSSTGLERWMERPDPNMKESPDYWRMDGTHASGVPSAGI